MKSCHDIRTWWTRVIIWPMFSCSFITGHTLTRLLVYIPTNIYIVYIYSPWLAITLALSLCYHTTSRHANRTAMSCWSRRVHARYHIVIRTHHINMPNARRFLLTLSQLVHITLTVLSCPSITRRPRLITTFMFRRYHVLWLHLYPHTTTDSCSAFTLTSCPCHGDRLLFFTPLIPYSSSSLCHHSLTTHYLFTYKVHSKLIPTLLLTRSGCKGWVGVRAGI